MKLFNFYDDQDYLTFIKRLGLLSKDDQPKWGKMNSFQMLRHLNLALGCGLGYYSLKDTSNIFTRTLIKTYILKIKKGFKKSEFTPKTLRVVENDFDFNTEKNKLKEILDEAKKTTKDSDWQAHPFFGKMTYQEWGILLSIHLDHHFRQFDI